MPAINRIVFRDTAREIPGQELVARLKRSIGLALRSQLPSDAIDALLLSGQLESALIDRGWHCSQTAEALTNLLSAKVIGRLANDTEIVRQISNLEKWSMPPQLRISPAEGFSYYALHPADFADAVAHEMGPIAVIGIRSIGTVLSAVVLAALNARGIGASRITVRPGGHPYNRTLEFNAAQRSWVEEQRANASRFLIVDEGPGLSGSSFLAAAEALLTCGVHQNQITLIGTRDVDSNQLCAADAPRRWSQFSWRRVPSSICREFGHFSSVSGGSWRNHVFPAFVEWPACWPEMERLKFLSADGESLLKFDGFGEPGAQARARARAVHDAGFGPSCETADDGMSRYQFVNGRPLTISDCSRAVLERLAEYCAFRVNEFTSPIQDENQLEEMTRFNFAQEFGRDLVLPPATLSTKNPIAVDGRMQPHEWIAAADGSLSKVDAATHGDDHFMPGSTDIAWDLAGTSVEWHLNGHAAEFLLGHFRARTGLDLHDRFQFYVLAYAIFRLSYCRMAASGTQSSDEKPRLQQACELYRRRILETCRILNTSAI